ncbi:MAG: hypothetical protein Q8O40_16125 [Chloroflexota bacterium]|nr:hypothetical protein [Chloroflexota bacterium]
MEKGKSARRTGVARFALAGLLALAALSSIASFVAYGDDGSGRVLVQTAPEAGALVYGAPPRWTATAGVPAQIDAPGDLYLIDATGVPDPITVALHLVNPGELVRSYSYLHLKLGVYQYGPGGWTKAAAADDQPISESYLTLLNGQASFILAGGRRYAITIDDGSYLARPASAQGANASPKFYVSVTP